MIAIIKLTGKFYGKDLSDLDNDEIVEYVESFTSTSEAVTLVDFIESACELFDIEKSDIEMVVD